MNKIIKICILIVIIVVTVISVYVVKSKNNKSDQANKENTVNTTNTTEKDEIIMEKKFYFSKGSITLQIHENGEVYEDVEIEEPNHKPDFKKIKELNSEEIEELKSKLEQSDEELQPYLMNLIYGDSNYELK